MIFQVNSLIIATLFLLFAATILDSVVAARQLRGEGRIIASKSNNNRILVETNGCPEEGQYCPDKFPGVGSHNYSNCNSEMSDIQVAECVYNPGDAMLSWSRVTNSMETSKHDKTTIKDTSGYNVCSFTDGMLTCE